MIVGAGVGSDVGKWVGAVGVFVGDAVVGFFVHVGASVGPYVGGAGADVGSYWARAAASSHKKYIFMAALLSSRMAAHFFGVRPSEIFRRQQTQRQPAHARQLRSRTCG